MREETEPVDDFLAQRRVAVIGVSTDRSKYGWVVYDHLKQLGYEVFAVNPRHKECHGEPCYPTVADLPESVGLAVAVVPPAVTEQIVPQLVAAGIKRLWLQPGAESPQAIAAARASGLRVIHGACIMVAAGRRREG